MASFVKNWQTAIAAFSSIGVSKRLSKYAFNAARLESTFAGE
jgi:hypothetical protein